MGLQSYAAPTPQENTLSHRWACLAVTIHVQTPDAAIVALPVVIFDWNAPTDVNALIIVLGKAVKAKLQEGRDASVSQVSSRIVRHKKEDLEIGGHRYVIAACWSDRPAVEILVPDGNEMRVVVHCYAAMGLVHQHAIQQVLLARTYSMEAAAAVAFSCQTLLKLGPPV